jgi:hypothetical protein
MTHDQAGQEWLERYTEQRFYQVVIAWLCFAVLVLYATS